MLSLQSVSSKDDDLVQISFHVSAVPEIAVIFMCATCALEKTIKLGCSQQISRLKRQTVLLKQTLDRERHKSAKMLPMIPMLPIIHMIQSLELFRQTNQQNEKKS